MELRVVKRYINWVTYEGVNKEWKYFIQSGRPRFGFFGDIVWRDFNAIPYDTETEARKAVSALTDGPRVGEQHTVYTATTDKTFL